MVSREQKLTSISQSAVHHDLSGKRKDHTDEVEGLLEAEEEGP